MVDVVPLEFGRILRNGILATCAISSRQGISVFDSPIVASRPPAVCAYLEILRLCAPLLGPEIARVVPVAVIEGGALVISGKTQFDAYVRLQIERRRMARECVCIRADRHPRVGFREKLRDLVYELVVLCGPECGIVYAYRGPVAAIERGYAAFTFADAVIVRASKIVIVDLNFGRRNIGIFCGDAVGYG